MLTDRIGRLRARVTSAAGVWDAGWGPLRDQSLRRTAGRPDVIREAEAIAHYLRNRAIVIHDDELIVGSSAQTEVPPAPPLPAEAQMPGYAYIPEQLDARLQRLLDCGLLGYAGNHTTIDYPSVLAEGLVGLQARIDRATERLPADEGGRERRDFLAALRIVAQGAVDMAQRYADLAESLAAAATDARRRDDLRAIAAHCAAVPAGAAKDFRQACQSLWFTFFLMPDSPGRIDQYLGPFYRRDLQRGAIDREHALELIACLWLKYFELFGAQDPVGARHHITLGGLTPEGADAANAMTELCLEVTEELRLFRPQVTFRWHRGTGRELLNRAARVLRSGTGHPSFCSDEQIAHALMDVGVAPEDARDYSLSGCSEVIVSGKSQMGSVEGFLNAPKLLEMVLGLAEGMTGGAHLEAIGTWEQFRAALAEAVGTVVAGVQDLSERLDAVRARRPGGDLMASLLVRDCIDSARGYTQGGARYNFCNWNAVGIANLADSLTAVRRLVFETGELALPELRAILAADWAGHEPLRLRVLREVPHYGNDADPADAVAADVVRLLAEALKTRTPFRGGQYILGTLAGVENMHIVFGRRIGATPDGRKAGQPLADSLGAAQGRDRHGPTAMLNSVAKLPHRLLPTATTVNVKLDPTLLDGGEGAEKIAALVAGYFQAGGQQVQFTLVNGRMLREAKEHPEQHAGLIVRVAGYSAPYVALDAELQDEILRRTEHRL